MHIYRCLHAPNGTEVNKFHIGIVEEGIVSNHKCFRWTERVKRRPCEALNPAAYYDCGLRHIASFSGVIINELYAILVL